MQGLLFAVGYNLRTYSAIALENTKYGLLECPSAALAFAVKATLPFPAKIAFIDLYATVEFFFKPPFDSGKFPGGICRTSS